MGFLSCTSCTGYSFLMMFYIVASCKFAKAAIYHVPDEAMMPLPLKMSLEQKNTHILYMTYIQD